jgi:hypothetical protein
MGSIRTQPSSNLLALTRRSADGKRRAARVYGPPCTRQMMHISQIAISALRRAGSAPMEVTMSASPIELGHNQLPWNKGRLLGQKRPLRPKDVWAIRIRLQLEGRARDLAMFNLAIDSKLRGCDLVRLQTTDICLGGRVKDRAVVVQKKTGRPVQFELTEHTRSSVQDWIDHRSTVVSPTCSRVGLRIGLTFPQGSMRGS